MSQPSKPNPNNAEDSVRMLIQQFSIEMAGHLNANNQWNEKKHLLIHECTRLIRGINNVGGPHSNPVYCATHYTNCDNGTEQPVPPATTCLQGYYNCMCE